MANPKVKAVTMELISTGMPEQFEGQLDDGRFYYIRFEMRLLSLGVGATMDEAIGNGSHEPTSYEMLEVKAEGDPYGIGENDPYALGRDKIRELLAHVIELPESTL